MGATSAGAAGWHSCAYGVFQGNEEQQQSATSIDTSKGCLFRKNYGRGLSVHRSLSLRRYSRRICISKWFNGHRARLKNFHPEQSKQGSKNGNYDDSDSVGLLQHWNGQGPICPFVYHGVPATVLCNADESGVWITPIDGDGGSGNFEKHVQISEEGVNQSSEEQEENDLVGSRANVTDEISSKLVKVWKVLRSILPYGSWWDVGEKAPREKTSITFKEAMVRLWGLISSDKLVIAMAFTALVIAALSEITIPHYVAASIFSAQSGMTDQFYRNVKLLAVLSCTYGLFSGIRGGCFGIANQILVRRMREKLFANLLNQDIAFFDQEAVGTLTSRLGSDCQQVSRIIGNDLNVMFRNGLQGVGAFVYLVTLSWQMALSTFSIAVIMWSCMRFYGRYQKSTAKAAQDTVASANEVAEETLSLARVVRTFGTETEEMARYCKWSKKLIDINFRQNVAYAFWTWSSNTLYNATQVIALLIGGGYVMSGVITAQQLTTFVLYSEWVVHSVWWVGDHWGSLMQAIGASEKVFNLLDLPPSQQLFAKGCTLPAITGRIKFKNIWFYYPARPQVPVLRNVNLSIYPGEIIAMVGLSGSGKSSIVGLLLRHYEPSQGEVIIDGTPLTDLDVRWFRGHLGVVNQEPRLFSMDVASNISYGCAKIVTYTDIKRAAKQANAHDFIMALPERYKTVVDNTRLSGGQKQRIAIARAILRDPAILVLDEATSALDSESEHLVQKALDCAMCIDGQRRRTVLVIAHRLSTIRAADRIIVMHHGQVVEMGNHDELLQLNGAYARLTRRQVRKLSQVSSQGANTMVKKSKLYPQSNHQLQEMHM